jgi:predicted acetyltransferase
MADIEVRALREGELRAFLTAVSTAFSEEINEEELASNERIFEPDRVFVATDAERIVGGGGSFSFQMTVPGGASVGAAGVTAVGTMPTHRRQGILRRVMRELLSDAQTHDDAVAILWASEGSIYQRFGYGMGAYTATLEIAQDRATFRDEHPIQGRTRFVDATEAARLLPPIFAVVCAGTPGMFRRSQTWWESEILPDPERWRRGAGPKFFVVHETDGIADGYVIYRVKSQWEDGGFKSVLMIRELVAATVSAERELWRYVFSVDLILTVRANNQRADHPLLLMLTEPARLRLVMDDPFWLRLVDIERALSARSYASPERVVLELSDAFMPENAGHWLLDATGERPVVQRTEEAADLALNVNDLANLYLGAFSATDLGAAGRTTERMAGARARVDRLFATPRKPWTPTAF